MKAALSSPVAPQNVQFEKYQIRVELRHVKRFAENLRPRDALWGLHASFRLGVLHLCRGLGASDESVAQDVVSLTGYPSDV